MNYQSTCQDIGHAAEPPASLEEIDDQLLSVLDGYWEAHLRGESEAVRATLRDNADASTELGRDLTVLDWLHDAAGMLAEDAALVQGAAARDQRLEVRDQRRETGEPVRVADRPAIDPFGSTDRSCAGTEVDGSARAHPLTTPPRARTPLPVLDDYELLEEIGRGGMGVVYRARQVSLNRLVAIKTIQAGAWASAKDVQRFLTEARAAASLQHPNIIGVHASGEHHGRHFFSMELVDGPNLAQLARTNPLTSRQAAQCVRAIAEAVHYAHEHGLLHRDLKPSNILVDASGRVRVTDFGLAKLVNEDSDLTSTGCALGTPSYMAPEQAAGRLGDIGRASDGYSLGAILYELLTGRPPFRAETSWETARQVLERDPVSPRLLNPKLPHDLETICLKCLDKEPRRRYATAQELADELDRFLSGEPIQARPLGIAARAWRWCRRKPVTAVLIGCVLLALSGGVSGIAWQWSQAEQHRRRSEEMAAGLAMDRGIALCERGELGAGLLWLARSLELAPADAADLRWAIRSNLSSWHNEAIRLRAVLEHDSAVVGVASFDEGKVATGVCADGQIRLWETAQGTSVAYTSAGNDIQCISLAADGETALILGRASTTATADLLGDSGPQSSQGRLRTVARLWNLREGRPIAAPLPGWEHVTAVALSRDGSAAIAATTAKTAWLWDIAGGKRLDGELPHDSAIGAVCFSADGRSAMTGCSDGTVWLWDLTAKSVTGKLPRMPGGVAALSLDRDGTKVVIGCTDNTARIWHLVQERWVGEPLRHQGIVKAVAFSPDGSRALTASYDKTARLWDATSGLAAGQVMPHSDFVLCGAFCPDGCHVLTGSKDKTLRIWEVPDVRLATDALPAPGFVKAVSFSKDGRLFTTASTDRTARLWETASGRAVGEPMMHDNDVLSVAISPDGSKLLTGCSDGTARFWDLTTHESLSPQFPHDKEIRAVALSPDGRTVVTAGHGIIRFWDARSGAVKPVALRHAKAIDALAFSPDGKMLVSGGDDNTARIWDVEDGRQMGALQHEGAVRAVAFSDDGRMIVTGSHDNTARVWNSATGAAIGLPMQHRERVQAVAFLRGGRTVISACPGFVGIWDVKTGRAIGPPLERQSPVRTLAFGIEQSSVTGGTVDHHPCTWTLASAVLDEPRRITLWAELITCMELDGSGATHVLGAGDWERRKEQFDQLGGEPIASP